MATPPAAQDTRQPRDPVAASPWPPPWGGPKHHAHGNVQGSARGNVACGGPFRRDRSHQPSKMPDSAGSKVQDRPIRHDSPVGGLGSGLEAGRSVNLVELGFPGGQGAMSHGRSPRRTIQLWDPPFGRSIKQLDELGASSRTSATRSENVASRLASARHTSQGHVGCLGATTAGSSAASRRS
jgi:hypothetical protein